MEMGMIGLGRMGGRMAQCLLSGSHRKRLKIILDCLARLKHSDRGVNTIAIMFKIEKVATCSFLVSQYHKR